MYKIRKGSIISESAYGVELFCEIVSDVEEISHVKLGKPDIVQQKFTAKVISVNGKTKSDGSVVEYLVGGTYGTCIEVLEY